MSPGAVSSKSLFAFAAPQIEKIPLHVSEHDQVQQAVIVQINPGGARRPPAASHSRLCGNVGECAVTVVVVQFVASIAGHVQVFIAIIVVIANGDPKSIADTL